MKKAIAFFCLFLLFSCNEGAVEKPQKLIEADQMVNIIYDLSILEAMHSRNPIENNISPHAYILKKYKVDSLQFAQNNRYYAADLANYKKMYEKVDARIQQEKNTVDSLVKKSGNATPPVTSGAPQVQ